MVTSQDISKALSQLGIKEGDTILTHSSFKSLGETENGADTVINGMFQTVGESGTVIFPTLCQEDWLNVYKNWTMDSNSDVGYLTNYFRKLPGALRSNQATHSVAAIGKDAAYITNTHGQSGLRYGIFGDTPFSADSPWEKMYNLNTKIIFLGVGIRKCTFRHYAEYCFIEECLKRIQSSSECQRLKEQIWCYDRWNDAGVWPHINSEYVREILQQQGLIHKAVCGNAELLMVSAQDFVNTATKLLKEKEALALSDNHEYWTAEKYLKWLKELESI